MVQKGQLSLQEVQNQTQDSNQGWEAGKNPELIWTGSDLSVQKTLQEEEKAGVSKEEICQDQ